MAYLIDTTQSNFVANVTTNSATIGTPSYTLPSVRAPGPGYILKDTAGDGNITWQLHNNEVKSKVEFNFAKIIGTGSTYVMTTADSAIDIDSNNYWSVQLPSSVGCGGRVFLISNSTPNKLTLLAVSGQVIDGEPTYKFIYANTRIVVVSNNETKWYIM